MIRHEKEGIVSLQFELLEQFSKLRHSVFLRHGGVSGGAFGSLNIGASVGDNLESVRENRRRVLTCFSGSELVTAFQVHGDLISEGGVPSDGLITQEKGKPLMIQHADCQAAIFYDPIAGVVANIHSGWKGSVQNIYAKAVEACKKKGSHPANLFVCISPSLGPNASEFIHYKKELPESFQEFRLKDCHFDFWEISRMQLMEEGILPSHIQIASICTYENKEDYFSYRRDKVTGRHATVVELS